MVTETSCSLSRAKVRVASRELVSNVECVGTRLTDAGREERVKEERRKGGLGERKGRIKRKLVKSKSLVGQFLVKLTVARQGVWS